MKKIQLWLIVLAITSFAAGIFIAREIGDMKWFEYGFGICMLCAVIGFIFEPELTHSSDTGLNPNDFDKLTY